MCLYTKDDEPLIAEEDIKVYKQVAVSFDNNRLTSYFLNSLIPYNGILRPDSSKIEIKSGYMKSYYIKGGVIHSYITDTISDKNSILIRGIIPKGTKYFVGAHNDLASKKLILDFNDPIIPENMPLDNKKRAYEIINLYKNRGLSNFLVRFRSSIRLYMINKLYGYK